MEDDAKAAAAIDSTEHISVRAHERTVVSDYPPVELPHGWAFGRYELLGRLAYGGMAEIYLARESAYGLAVRYVVIKRVLPHIANDSEFVGLFMDEARVAMSLTHPHISHIYEFGRIEGSYFLAMEWVNGVALNKLIKRAITCERPLPVSVAVKALAGVARALDYAHAARDESGQPLGIVHRDVTPHNIMLTFDGSVKLLDFGIAMAASRSTDTRTGLVRGKLAYMSPQQCLARAIDGRSDIFSLGVCLYEAVTGQRLYRRETDFEVCEAIIKGPVPSIRDVNPELDEELDAIVQRCLAKEPDERFQRAGELQTALEKYLADRREAVGNSMVSEVLRELFPVQYKNGPKLDTKTDLLNSLPRVQGPTGPQVLISSAPPTPSPAAATHVEPANDVDPDPPHREITSSETRTVATPVGQGMAYTFLVLLMAAVGLAGFAVWSLLNRPTPVVLAPLEGDVGNASARAPAPAPEGRAAAASSAPQREKASSDETQRDEEDADDPDRALKGSMWLTSDPPGVAIFINGNPTGRRTPAQLEGIWPGVYRITLRKHGYETYRTRVTVEAGQVTQMTADVMTDAEAREFYRRRAKRAHRGTDDERDADEKRARREDEGQAAAPKKAGDSKSHASSSPGEGDETGEAAAGR